MRTLGIGVVLLALVFPGVYAQPSEDRQVEMITLKDAYGVNMMCTLGLHPLQDLRGTSRPAWYADAQKPGKSQLVPDGIDFVMPYLQVNALVVGGSRSALGEFRALLEKLDIPPQKILIKVEVILSTPALVRELGLDCASDKNDSPQGWTNCGRADSATLQALRQQILNNQAKLLNIPMLSTLDFISAGIATGALPSAEKDGSAAPDPARDFAFSVLPMINPADNSITLQILKPEMPPSTSLFHIPPGETLALSRMHEQPGKVYLLFVTPKIVK